MKWLTASLLLYLFSGRANSWLFKKDPLKVCYGSLGCFSSRYPYSNTPAVVPRSPSVIGTKFLLTTLESHGRLEQITLNDEHDRFSCKNFRQTRLTKIIIHGYIHTVDELWVRKMVEELLKHADFNILLVDWRGGSSDINYMQCASNIRVVGALIAKLLRKLHRHCDLDLSDVHIIGHSLGAHAAGYAGENLKGIGRITGLDPAGPLFEGKDPAVRLDPDDAIFVDVIHTDGEHLFDLDMIQNVGCSHLRAVDLFTESINSNCLFQAYPCSVINKRTDEMCSVCKGGCAVMGLHTEPTTPPGKYALMTGSSSPFCTIDIEHKEKAVWV